MHASTTLYLSVAVAMTVLGWCLTGLALHYARHRQLIDQPGLRRSHQQPTPRGGGLGFVLASLCLVVVLGWTAVMPTVLAWATVVAGLLLGLVSFLDDHRDVPARVRLCAQLLAVIILLGAVGVPTNLDLAPLQWSAETPTARWGVAVVWLLGLVWLVNLTNFMDGSNGLVGIAVSFAGIAMGVLNALAGETDLAMLGLGLGGATLGFLPWNFPRARIFMGDVGSTVAGFLLGVLMLESQRRQSVGIALSILVVAPMALDATLTVVKRAAKRRALARAHREHLYQLLIRGGYSHTEVALAQTAVLLVVVLPLMVLVWRESLGAGWALLLFSLGFAILWQTWRNIFWRRRGRLRTMGRSK